jgi:uroporphyrinogen III methyltransferase/synthase
MPSLTGRRIVVTRAANQAEQLAAPLRALGADVVLLPTISIAAPEDPAPLRQAAGRADQYDWIVFTSANAIESFAAQLLTPISHLKARIAAVGSSTAAAAEAVGFHIALIPERYVAESLLEAFQDYAIAGQRFLMPQAAIARDLVPTDLRKRGALVDVVEAYRNVLPPETALAASTIFHATPPDWVLFASSSAVHNLLSLVPVSALQTTRIATIGPVASETVRSYGLVVHVEANPHTIAGLAAAVVKHSMP